MLPDLQGLLIRSKLNELGRLIFGKSKNLIILCNQYVIQTMQDYSRLSDEIKGKLVEELGDDMDKLEEARKRIVFIMEGLTQHKIPNEDAHNFMVETIRTQLEVCLDNLDNALYQTKELLSQVE